MKIKILKTIFVYNIQYTVMPLTLSSSRNAFPNIFRAQSTTANLGLDFDKNTSTPKQPTGDINSITHNAGILKPGMIRPM